MSEKTASVRGSQRSSFGVIFLTIFLDMIGFSVIFPLFPEMLKHYLEREKRGEGGFVTTFVESVHGLEAGSRQSRAGLAKNLRFPLRRGYSGTSETPVIPEEERTK